ncbi:hypothetical protein [Spartinivicinus poritis]|uniref:Uncharacterized protein n=1 Tax=Spartinivicinus poritis TaxID=2994640 RepID=A0ABT5U6X3_9GAMM|nr:hypothetical protein [Spartinivicinus sp. A2-2]MDE1462115.1 hypothetical protein [Spartinivicinus sp. A2-2]
MGALTKIRLTSLAAIIGLVSIVLYNLFLLVSEQSYSLENDATNEVHRDIFSFILIEFAYQVVIVGLLVSIFYQFYRGNIFTDKNLKFLFSIGLIFLLYPIYHYLGNQLLDLHTDMPFIFNMTLMLLPGSYKEHVIVGIIILPIAYILNLGRVIKSELEDYI